ncbi:MAG: ThiF family adenylyltransferase [Bacteroidales bacterium]|nr:ThiF family adenylyltransferase [Bacteroidales bacterium]
MHSRNQLYISASQQDLIGRISLLFAGAGIGSVAAECALRLGFKNITIYDGDVVELSNLNRQNYVAQDIGKPKTESIHKRLKAIDPDAAINACNEFLDNGNIESAVVKCDIAVNAIDFNSSAWITMDDICQSMGKTVVHPYNFGWASCAYVVTPASQTFRDILNSHQPPEVCVAMHTLNCIKQQAGHKTDWIYDTLKKYEAGNPAVPPQLSVGNFLAAGAVTSLLFSLANNQAVPVFPEPAFVSARF